MKKLAIVAALATLIASPAFAQQLNRLQSTHGVIQSSLDDYVVIANGQVVGQDPDINVRLDLLRQADYYLGQ